MKSRFWAVVAALALVPVGAQTAVAGGEASDLTVSTYALPPAADPPSLGELRGGDGTRTLERLSQTTPRDSVPMEYASTVTQGRRISRTPSASSDEAAGRISPQAASYPEPSRAMTRAECTAGLQGGKIFYIKSRFAMCTGARFVQTWARDNIPVGESSFALWVISTVPSKTSRTVHYRYLFTDFLKTGATATAGLRIDTDAKITTWPARTAKIQTGAPPAKTFDQFKAAPDYLHTILHEPGQGTGTDDIVTMAYEPYVTITYPPPYMQPTPQPVRVGFLAAQWDTASYLFNKTGGGHPKKKGGAAFPVKVNLPYSKQAGAAEQQVAIHLYDAHTRPAVTKPVNPAKKVPGFAVNQPLHRLFHDTARRDRNRSTAVATCVREWGADYPTSDPAGPRECDEYPFASTYEGAAQNHFQPSQPKDNYSARPIARADNGAGGNILATFLDRNRIIDGYLGTQEVDAYTVKIS